MTLKDLIEKKDHTIISAKGSDTTLDAIRTMCDSRVGSLLVYADNGDLLGIVTERDILRFCADNAGRLDSTPLEEVATRDLVVMTPDSSIDQAMSLMTERRFRHLPIMEGSEVVCLVSIGDLVKAKLKDVSVEVKYLRDYISA